MSETKNEVKSTEVKKAHPSEKSFISGNKSLLMLMLLAIVFFTLLCVAFALGTRADDQTFRDAPRFDGGRMMMRDDSGMGDGKRGGMTDDGFGHRSMMRGDANITSSTRVMGVVTDVDGDTITVAGNGTTTKVTVNDNTTHTGEDKPAKVNDTIMATGARDADNNLVASSVRLSRQ